MKSIIIVEILRKTPRNCWKSWKNLLKKSWRILRKNSWWNLRRNFQSDLRAKFWTNDHRNFLRNPWGILSKILEEFLDRIFGITNPWKIPRKNCRSNFLKIFWSSLWREINNGTFDLRNWQQISWKKYRGSFWINPWRNPWRKIERILDEICREIVGGI